MRCLKPCSRFRELFNGLEQIFSAPGPGPGPGLNSRVHFKLHLKLSLKKQTQNNQHPSPHIKIHTTTLAGLTDDLPDFGILYFQQIQTHVQAKEKNKAYLGVNMYIQV